LKYGSTKLRLYDDRRGMDGGDGVANGSESFSDLRLSGAYVGKLQELHVELQPKIEQSRGDAALRRPVTVVLAYRRETAPTRVLLVDADYALRGAFEGEANTFAVRGGMALLEPGLPVLGGLVGYAHKSFAEATAAAPDTVSHVDLTLFLDYRSDAHTHYALSLDAATGQGDGATPGGDSTKVESQALSYQASFLRSF
jgi:hypothetical protein